MDNSAGIIGSCLGRMGYCLSGMGTSSLQRQNAMYDIREKKNDYLIKNTLIVRNLWFGSSHNCLCENEDDIKLQKTLTKSL